MLLHRHIIGTHFSGNFVGHIERTITLLISIEIMQNLGSNSSSESVLSITFWPHPEIPYRSEVIAETWQKVTFQHIFWAITARKLLASNVYFTQNFISSWLVTRYRTNISMPNSRADRWTSIFTPLHRHIIVVRFSGNSVGHIQRTITLLISNEIMQNLWLNSSSECVLSKTLRRHQKIPCRSKVIVKTVTKGHFSTHFLSDYGSKITSQ